MAQITISDDVYQALLAAAAARGASPDALIAAGLEALDDHRLTTEKPMTADEFAKALGMTPEDIARADEEAQRLYPECFPDAPAQA